MDLQNAKSCGKSSLPSGQTFYGLEKLVVLWEELLSPGEHEDVGLFDGRLRRPHHLSDLVRRFGVVRQLQTSETTRKSKSDI